MEQLARFCRLPPAERLLLLAAVLLLTAVRVGLRILPLRTVLRLLSRLSGVAEGRAAGDEAMIERVGWAVTVASRYVPAATCLAQALVTETLLRRLVLPADLRLGVARDAMGCFQAHAWVECRGRVVIGGAVLDTFTPLPPLAGLRR